MRRATRAPAFVMSSQRPRPNPNPNPFGLSFTFRSYPPHPWRRPFSQPPPRPVFPHAPPSPAPYAPRPLPPPAGAALGHPQGPRPSPRPRPLDYRSWIPTRSPPPPPRERFKVLSYNILADYLARDHRLKLYPHIPMYILDWEWRKRRILLEFGLWSADILCLQEVDRFSDIQEELALRGYQGIWKMRTGAATDGCATFWRTNRFQLRHEEHIEFNKLGLRDNVAQICVLESRSLPVSTATSFSVTGSPSFLESKGGNQVVVCNIHVLYNPKRGDIKLGQVRVLIDKASNISKLCNDAPVIICGDFNSTPESPLYKFISEQKLDLSGLPRDQVSGQYSYVQTQSRFGDKFLGVHKLQGSNNVKANAGEPDKGSQNERVPDEPVVRANLNKSAYPGVTPKVHMHGPPEMVKCENILEKDVEAHVSIKQITDDENHLNVSNSENRVTKDTSMEATLEDCQYDDVRGPKQNLCCTTVVNEVFVNNEASSKETLDNSVSVQILSQSVSINRTVLPLDTKVPSCSYEESFSCSSVKSSNETLELALYQESSIHSGDVDMNKAKKAAENNGEDFSTFKQISACKNDADAHILPNILQDSGDGSDKHDNLSIEHSIFEQDTEEHCQSSSKASQKVNLDGEISISWLEELAGIDSPAELHGKKSMNGFSKEDEASDLENNLQTASSSNQGVWRPFYDPSQWTPEEIVNATGNAECFLLQHELELNSAYALAKGMTETMDSNREPHVTSYNRKFMGTVDYIWFSKGLKAVKVLETIPKDVLQRTPGFPTSKWGSDHISLACEFAFSKAQTEDCT